LGLRDVIGHVTIRLPGVDLLFVVYSDHASIFHRYGDMAFQILDTRTWTRKKDGRRKREKGRERRRIKKQESGRGKGNERERRKGMQFDSLQYISI